MDRQTPWATRAARLLLGRLAPLAALVCTVYAAGPRLRPSEPPAQVTFSVGPDEALTYPANLPFLPDEHTTIIPPGRGSDPYLVFAASTVTGGSSGGWAVALESRDLRTFTFPAGYNSPVMSNPIPIGYCDPTYDLEFDENYAAPGSVVRDPTLPRGNMMMIYEAENHCAGGTPQFPFYATVGFARSSDNGKTWPQAVASEFGGADRYPILKSSTPEPTTPEPPPVNLGNALPSAFVDAGRESEHDQNGEHKPDREPYLYVTYELFGPGADGMIRVARAKLGGGEPLTFSKWFNGAFTEPGLGGHDSGVLPARGCHPNGFQTKSQISRNDALDAYLMTFVCVSYIKDPTGAFQPYQAAWYFSTATSLDLQNWTTPQLIEHSQFPVAHPCDSFSMGGEAFDGWYPSFMSPGSPAGHTSKEGYVFFLNGCDLGLARRFTRRPFQIRLHEDDQHDGRQLPISIKKEGK